MSTSRRARFTGWDSPTVKNLGSDVLSIRREAVEQTGAPGRLQLLLTAATRAMRGIPGPHMPRVFQAKAAQGVYGQAHRHADNASRYKRASGFPSGRLCNTRLETRALQE